MSDMQERASGRGVAGQGSAAAPAGSASIAEPGTRVAWFTYPRVYTFLVAWLALLGVMSIYVSAPFQTEASAGANIDWRHTMFLHGLLIGLVGLVSLMVVESFQFRSRHARQWILIGAMVATVLAALGGTFDTNVKDTFALWTQITGFFALDEILIVLVVAFAGEWRARAASVRAWPFWAAWAGSISMLIAAIMGHLAGWLLEFGEHSPFDWPASYAGAIGVKFDDWVANLIGSHSHEMVIAVFATLFATVVWEYGYRRHADAVVGALSKVGLAMVVFGTIAMTVIYVVAGFTQYQPPTLFQFGAGGANGIAGDDLVTGVFVLIGGLLSLTAIVHREAGLQASVWRMRLSAALLFLISVLTVVGAGFAIELNETFFGAGAGGAAGAANDAVFTFWHQDFAFFMIPILIALLWVADHYVRPAVAAVVESEVGIGVAVAFLGGLIYVFLDPALYGVGYLIAGAGLVIIAYGVVRLWWGLLNEPKAPALLGVSGGGQAPAPARLRP